MNDPPRSPKLKDWHPDRRAIVYARQSAPQRVIDHQESTARQYALADRAADLGWSAGQVHVIDDDPGRGGQPIEGRLGFQRLLAEVALGRVGLILGLEVSRLARSCKDWHHLLELCARFRTPLADAGGLYDPADHDDRLLLGLHGMMSEAELHVPEERMYQGKLNKARRGELLGAPPIGYARLLSGEWAIDPDEQVRATVHLVFDEFDRQGAPRGLLRYLASHKIRIPVRPASGANRGNLEWRRPSRMTLQSLLHHPTYAGAYRYGHRPVDSRRKRPGRPGTGKRSRRPEECLVLIRDRHPACITWGRFEANRDRLEANRARQGRPGAPRQGPSLLAGLIRCGLRGRRMLVQYSGAEDRLPYRCTRGSGDYAEPRCQCLSGPSLDGLIRDQILSAVAPAALEASLSAVAEVERERSDLSRQWRLRLERASYEAERSARQCQACEPENRLVGRESERRREEPLTLQERVGLEYERWQRSTPGRLPADDERAIRSLAADPPSVWHAAAATPAERKKIARLSIEHVSVSVDKASERVAAEVHRAGGLVQTHSLDRPAGRYEHRSDYPRLVSRLRVLCEGRLSPAEIAERLNAEGFVPPKRADRLSGPMVWRLASRLGLKWRGRHGSPEGLGQDEYRPKSLALRLDVGRDTIRWWVRAGCIATRKDEQGHHVIWADEAELQRPRDLHRLLGIRVAEGLADLKRPKPRPERWSVEVRLTSSWASLPHSWRVLWLEHRDRLPRVQAGRGGRPAAGAVHLGERRGLPHLPVDLHHDRGVGLAP